MSDIEDFKNKVSSTSNEKLCEIVVSYRYLGILQEEAVLCMEELSNRRTLGDTFEFEKHIEKLFNDLPKFKLDMKKILNSSGINIKNILGFFK